MTLAQTGPGRVVVEAEMGQIQLDHTAEGTVGRGRLLAGSRSPVDDEVPPEGSVPTLAAPTAFVAPVDRRVYPFIVLLVVNDRQETAAFNLTTAASRSGDGTTRMVALTPVADVRQSRPLDLSTLPSSDLVKQLAGGGKPARVFVGLALHVGSDRHTLYAVDLVVRTEMP